MLMCSIKNRHTHRNKYLLVSYMLCQVRDTLAIQFFIFPRWIACYKAIKTLLRTHFTPASGTYMCTVQGIFWFFFFWFGPCPSALFCLSGQHQWMCPCLMISQEQSTATYRWEKSCQQKSSFKPQASSSIKPLRPKNSVSRKFLVIQYIDKFGKLPGDLKGWFYWLGFLFVCLISFLFFFSLEITTSLYAQGTEGVRNPKMFKWQCDSWSQVMLVNIMKLWCYIYAYRNLWVCICERWVGERGQCKNTINSSNLHRYLPSWHIYSQTTRNVLQIRVICNFLCLCQRPQPHAPARSSSPSTELRVRLCCLSSVHTVPQRCSFSPPLQL